MIVIGTACTLGCLLTFLDRILDFRFGLRFVWCATEPGLCWGYWRNRSTYLIWFKEIYSSSLRFWESPYSWLPSSTTGWSPSVIWSYKNEWSTHMNTQKTPQQQQDTDWKRTVIWKTKCQSSACVSAPNFYCFHSNGIIWSGKPAD